MKKVELELKQKAKEHSLANLMKGDKKPEIQISENRETIKNQHQETEKKPPSADEGKSVSEETNDSCIL